MAMLKSVRIAKKELIDRKAEDVQVVDVRENTPFADYYVLATAPNEKALGAFAGYVEEALEKEGVEVGKLDGTPESGWIIVDAGNVIIHIFSEAKRKEIALDELLAHRREAKK
jgi:ribosome-associated protein